VNYDNSLVVTIAVSCYSWAPSSSDHLFTCGAIYLPPHIPVTSHELYKRPCIHAPASVLTGLFR